MNILSPPLLILSLVISTILFILAAYFTRATLVRTLAALSASSLLIPFFWILDAYAARQGWWYYPLTANVSAPWAWYIANALVYGAALGLVGWRIVRRWGRSGLLAFVVGFGLFGLVRDSIYAMATGFIEFGDGFLPRIIDFLAYALAALLVQALMGWVVGPAGADPLARQLKVVFKNGYQV
jgi:hypothetical protein